MADREKLDLHLAAFYSGLKRRSESGGRNRHTASGAIQAADRVEKYLLDCEKQFLHQEDNDWMLIAIYTEQGAFFRAAGRCEASMEAYRRAQVLIAENAGKESPEYASSLNNMAMTCRMASQPKEALALFEEAAGIYKTLGDTGRVALAGVYRNIALVCREDERTEQAILYLERALEILRTLPGSETDAAIVCSNLISLYQQEGGTDKAMGYLEQALEAFETAEEVEDERFLPALNSLAGFLYSIGDCVRAIEVYQKAADYAERFYGRGLEYGTAFQNMYWVYRRMGKMESAIIVLATAQKVFTDIFGRNAERTRSVEDELQRITGAAAG